MIIKIGADWNGVGVNSHEGKRICVERKSKRIIPPDQFLGRAIVERKIPFKSSRRGVPDGPVTGKQYSDGMHLLFRTETYFEVTQPMPGAVDAFNLFMGLADELAIISATRGLNGQWVSQMMQTFEMPEARVHMTRGESKTKHYLECQVAIDDEIQHLEALDGTGTLPILMLADPATRGGQIVPPPPNLFRYKTLKVATGWEQVIALAQPWIEAKMAA